jgi:hypothetical protein
MGWGQNLIFLAILRPPRGFPKQTEIKMGQYTELVDQLEAEREAARHHRPTRFSETRRAITGPFGDAIAELQHRCPLRVDPLAWNQAVEDARRFLATWGHHARALGWTADDLFGLAHDRAGLVWMLHGRRVVAMTAGTAAIRSHMTGSITS